MAVFFRISKFLLYLVPFAAVIVTPSTLFPFIVGKFTYFKIIVESALIAFVLGWGFDGNSSPYSAAAPASKSELWKRPLSIAVSTFVAVFVFAGFVGINPSASFWSNFERGEGSFLLLHFYAYFLLLIALLKTDKDWSRLFAVSVAAGFLTVLYGIMASFEIPGFIGVSGFCARFAGSFGNPAYLGTFLIFMIFYAAHLLASGNWRSGAWRIFKLPIIVFFIGYFLVFLLFSQTRGALLGLGVGTVAAFFYLAAVLPSAKWRRLSFGAAVALVIVGFIGVNYRQYIDLAPWCGGGGGNRILDVSLGGETINTRFALWWQSIEMWKERPIFGWGPENFSMAFEKHYNPVHEVWFDRAHNIFFDYLVSAGILGLLSFLGIFAVYYRQFFLPPAGDKNAERRGNKNQPPTAVYQLEFQKSLFFALPIAYLVQGLVLFDVLPIYINLFLFLAFAVYKFQNFKIL